LETSLISAFSYGVAKVKEKQFLLKQLDSLKQERTKLEDTVTNGHKEIIKLNSARDQLAQDTLKVEAEYKQITNELRLTRNNVALIINKIDKIYWEV